MVVEITQQEKDEHLKDKALSLEMFNKFPKGLSKYERNWPKESIFCHEVMSEFQVCVIYHSDQETKVGNIINRPKLEVWPGLSWTQGTYGQCSLEGLE